MNYEHLDNLCSLCCNPVGDPLEDDTAEWINDEVEQRVKRVHKACKSLDYEDACFVEHGYSMPEPEIEQVYCDVCGLHYDIDDPCPFH